MELRCPMFERVLVAVDQEPVMARQVLSEAMTIAQVGPGQLRILQVLYPLKSGYPDPLYMTLDGAFSAVSTEAFGAYVTQWRELERTSQVNLDTYAAEARKAGLQVTTSQLIGEPGREICALAETWQADLIVLGRRGLQGVGELLLGSVSNFVMHRAPCAVLVVQGVAPVKETEAHG